PARIVVDPQDLHRRRQHDLGHVAEDRERAALAIADRVHAGDARYVLDRRLEPAAIERRAEGEAVGEEEARAAVRSRRAAEPVEHCGLDVAIEPAALDADLDAQVDREISWRRRIGFVAGEAPTVEQPDEL